jgi:beta-lactamase regulating signal transducer with metallopeptidase domain
MNTIFEIVNSAGKAFIEFALPMLVQSCILILILLLTDFFLRKKVRAVFRYWIWMLVLVKLILPTSLSSPLSIGYLFGDKLTSLPATPTPPEQPRPPATITTPIIGLTDIPQDLNTQPTPTVTSRPEPIPAQPIAPSPVPPAALSWQGIVFLLWLAVVIAMGLLLLQRAIFVNGLVAQASEAGGSIKDIFNSCCEGMGIRKRIGLKVSANAASPAVCGLFRPVILLPQNLSSRLNAGQLQSVLLHELAHIKRGDLWMNLVQTILQILYFYNPLLWIANTIIRRIREQAVDEMVLVAMGDKAQQYPQTLLDVAKLAFKRPALSLRLIGVVESKSALASRIKRILTRPIPKSAKLGIVGLIVVIIAAAVLIPMDKREKVIIGEGPEREMTLTLGWSGEKVKIPAPVVLPEWGRKTKEFELWKLGRVTGEITVFDIDDYKYVAQGHGLKKNVEGELNTVLYSVERYRPNGTLEANTLYFEADGDPTEWRTYNKDGNERIWVVNRPTAGDCKRKVIFYGPDGKETKEWQVSKFDVVYAELVTDPNGQSYFTHYLKELIHSPYPKQFTASLPNGVTIELLGLCSGLDTKERIWWRPDGRIANGDDFQIHNQDVKPMKWPDLPDRQFKYAYLFKVSPSDNSTVDTDVSVGDRWHTSYTSDKSVRIGYGYSHSGNVGDFPFEGGIKVAVAAGNHQQFESKVYDGAVNDMSILSDRTTNVTISGPRDDPAYSEKLIDVTLTSNEYDVAVVYELTDGTAKDARPESRMGGPHITSFFGKQNPLIRHSFRVSDPWEQIKKFVVKYRKYQLVTFKNVSLRPGIKADVQVEVEPSGKSSKSTVGEPAAQEPNESRGRIRGVMVNSITGKPVEGAYVGVGDFGDSGGSNYERHRAQGFFDKAETDPNGRFELDGLAYTDDHPEYDLHPLIVTHPDFVRHDEKIKLLKGWSIPDVKIALRPAAKINVTIVDSNGAPLEGFWLFRLEAMDGRRFIPPGQDPHLSAFASNVWIERLSPTRDTLFTTGFSFTELDSGEYSVEVIQCLPQELLRIDPEKRKSLLANLPLTDSQRRLLQMDHPEVTYHGGISNLKVEAGQTKEVQIKPADYQTSVTIKMPQDPVKKPQIPPFVVISRNVGLLAWHDGKAHGPEDHRLGRMEKNALYCNAVVDGDIFKIKNLPPGSYSVFAGPVYFMSATKMEVAGGRDVIVDIPPIELSEHAKVGLWTFNRRVKPQDREYSVSELCEFLNAQTNSNPSIIADPSIEKETVKLGKKEMSIWDLFEKIYLDNGWKLEEAKEAKTMILRPDGKPARQPQF